MPKFYMTEHRRHQPVGHIFIATPTYGGLIPSYQNSLDNARAELLNANYSVTTCILEGQCHVDDARNELVSVFVEKKKEAGYTHLMFIDADVSFSPNSILQLVSHDYVDIIAGIYPFKDDAREDFPIALKDGSFEFDMERGLCKGIEGLPGGFLLISSHVLLRLYNLSMAEKGWWHPRSNFIPERKVVELFHRDLVSVPFRNDGGKKRISGDYVFSAFARKHGFELWVDPNLTLGHEGAKRWTGNIGRYWMVQTGQHREHLRMASAILRGYDPKSAASDEELAKLASAIGTMKMIFGNDPMSAEVDLLFNLFIIASEADVQSVFEVGSGVSTALLNITGKLVTTFESEPSWGGYADRFMADSGITPRKGIVHAPIRDIAGVGRYYDPPEAEGFFGQRADLVFIDGPKRTDPHIRSRLLGLAPKLISDAKYVVIDDADDEQSMKPFLDRLNNQNFKITVMGGGATRRFIMAAKKE